MADVLFYHKHAVYRSLNLRPNMSQDAIYTECNYAVLLRAGNIINN